MKNLNEIANGYKKLFLTSGNPYFFMMYYNLEKLTNNIKATENVEEQTLEL